MPEVRKATSADVQTVATTLASAFADDPVTCWMSGQRDSERRMAPFWKTMARANLAKPDHELFVSADGASAAVWQGIDNWKVPPREILRWLPAMVASMRLRLPLAMQLLNAMERAHPKEPHYYLEFLGTRKDRQSRGGGSAVITVMLERCDTEGVGAYLESSNPRNVPFYARHGFREQGVVQGPKGGPSLTTMWRDPRG